MRSTMAAKAVWKSAYFCTRSSESEHPGLTVARWRSRALTLPAPIWSFPYAQICVIYSVKILVIGGTGFIRSYLVRELSEIGHSVSVFHRVKTQVNLPAESILGGARIWPDLV